MCMADVSPVDSVVQQYIGVVVQNRVRAVCSSTGMAYERVRKVVPGSV